MPYHYHSYIGRDCPRQQRPCPDLELGQRAVEVEDGVALLELLALLLGGREDHGQVGPVHLKEDGVLATHRVGQRRPAHQLLVLLVGELVLGTGRYRQGGTDREVWSLRTT